ncbi:NAD-dependent protein deacetylase [Arsenicicoccus sp. oral taxon 190]|uniref:NAD-dependent protein deacetylase n=1 Tax=Arsenicicoccus sp. oral taxon 190 TaxID=1658671 RepID=UPI000B271907|nr:NAD-dependent protein deacetylase [Arsenicicoccus sp. oral taxon 190]
MILDQLARLVHSGGVVALTGAGMSTESGIPDYRGPDGQRRVQPMTYAEFTGTSAARQRYWARAFVGWERFSAARPNAGHRALAALQRTGLITDVITQNVDGLHQEAGSTRVLELHGTLAVVRCLTCEDRTSREEVQRRLTEANPGFQVRSDEVRPDGDIALPDAVVGGFHLARCVVCGADTLKPDVVFFGEPVPRDRVDESYRRVEAAEALLVLGSSLKVMSGYRFVRRAHALGIPVAIITRGRTRGDDEASWQLDAPLGPALTGIATRLGIEEDFGPVVDGEYATGLPLGLT